MGGFFFLIAPYGLFKIDVVCISDICSNTIEISFFFMVDFPSILKKP